jgi:hypothetical protein
MLGKNFKTLNLLFTQITAIFRNMNNHTSVNDTQIPTPAGNNNRTGNEIVRNRIPQTLNNATFWYLLKWGSRFKYNPALKIKNKNSKIVSEYNKKLLEDLLAQVKLSQPKAPPLPREYKEDLLNVLNRDPSLAFKLQNIYRVKITYEAYTYGRVQKRSNLEHIAFLNTLKHKLIEQNIAGTFPFFQGDTKNRWHLVADKLREDLASKILSEISDNTFKALETPPEIPPEPPLETQTIHLSPEELSNLISAVTEKALVYGRMQGAMETMEFLGFKDNEEGRAYLLHQANILENQVPDAIRGVCANLFLDIHNDLADRMGLANEKLKAEIAISASAQTPSNSCDVSDTLSSI